MVLENCGLLTQLHTKQYTSRLPTFFKPDCVLLPGSAVLGKPARSEGDPKVLESGEERRVAREHTVGTSTSSRSRLTLHTYVCRQKTLYTQNAPFHVVITSYQLVVQDVKYFQRVKWQYMVLDEAQALKSSTR